MEAQQDETKQPPPSPSAEATTTLTTTSNIYLSTHLIVPYFITPNGTIKRPEHLIAWWSRIFSFYVPDEKDHIELRFLCRLFRDSLKPPPLYTFYPHPNYPALDGLMNKLNSVHEQDLMKAPKIVFVMEGTFHIPVGFKNYVTLGYPIMIIGAGQDKTTIHGGFKIEGLKEEEKSVSMQGMTMMGSRGHGLFASDGLSFSCKDMIFTQCRCTGVCVDNTKGRLINCMITHCGNSGIWCSMNGLIELEGSQTKVDGNVISGYSWESGLFSRDTSSVIHLLFPLTKESVSTNNHGRKNYGGEGTIQTVDSF
jgi:hypothetical protein